MGRIIFFVVTTINIVLMGLSMLLDRYDLLEDMGVFVILLFVISLCYTPVKVYDWWESWQKRHTKAEPDSV